MTKLSTKPLIHPTAHVRDCRFGAYTEIGARTRLLEVAIGDYSYVVNDSEMTYTTVGKFCSIAAMTRINPGNHPMDRASQSHFTYRSCAYFVGESDEDEFFAWRRAQPVVIAHDVWIGHGAIVLPGGGDEGRCVLCDRCRQSGARHPAALPDGHCRPAAAARMVELGARAIAGRIARLPPAVDRGLLGQA